MISKDYKQESFPSINTSKISESKDLKTSKIIPESKGDSLSITNSAFK